MKSSNVALVLTALFTNFSCNAVNIVTVQTERIIKESKWGLEIQSSITSEQKRLAAPFEKIEAEIKAKEAALIEKQKALAKDDENFKTQASLLSPDARADKYDELQKKHRELDKEVADFQLTMRQAHEDAKKVDQKLEMFYRKEMMAFEKEIKAIIEDTATTEGWDIVLAKEAVIFAGSTTDQSDIIIQKLDEKKAKEDKAKQAAKAVTKK
jgi:Skp family chaperone for outer membrane proteins